jgi:ubiquinone/menaquinone biosynthesis C-methylase UbiE
MISKARMKFFGAAKMEGHQVQLHCQDCLEYLRMDREGQFDMAIAAFILAYVKASELFPMVYRVLKKGGKFIVLTTSRKHGSAIERKMWKFVFTHPFYINWARLLTSRLTYLPSVEKIAGLLRRSKFLKVDYQEEPILVKIRFDNLDDWFDWLETSSLTSQYFAMLRRKKKGAALKELQRYAEDRGVDFLGEPLRVGRPFIFKWPIYKIIAEK